MSTAEKSKLYILEKIALLKDERAIQQLEVFIDKLTLEGKPHTLNEAEKAALQQGRADLAAGKSKTYETVEEAIKDIFDSEEPDA